METRHPIFNFRETPHFSPNSTNKCYTIPCVFVFLERDQLELQACWPEQLLVTRRRIIWVLWRERETENTMLPAWLVLESCRACERESARERERVLVEVVGLVGRSSFWMFRLLFSEFFGLSERTDTKSRAIFAYNIPRIRPLIALLSSPWNSCD